MKRRIILLCMFIICIPFKGISQYNFNTFFNFPALAFQQPDSNNLFYNEIINQSQMVSLFNEIFPFNTSEFYDCADNITPSDSLEFLLGLHNSIPNFDTMAAEVRSPFILNNKIGYWYAYYTKSNIDTTTAIVIFPGHGYHQSYYISESNPSNYHNATCMIKNKCRTYGDVYTIVKVNEDYRSIWKRTYSATTPIKMDYDVLGPYTDLNGKHWASNLYIECVALLKYLKSKYKKVMIIGLSNGGFPALVCGLSAKVDGINCASGISVLTYQGFPLADNENPYFSGIYDVYSLDSIKSTIQQNTTRVLFSYGSGDMGSNSYEYTNHAIQNYLNTPTVTCNTEFFYNFWGHTFPCAALDSFFLRVKKTPKFRAIPDTSVCTYDSLKFNLKFTGTPPFAFDLYKDTTLINSFSGINDTSFLITLFQEGNYHLRNLIDNNSTPLCKSESFQYIKPQLPNITQHTLLGRNCSLWLDSIRLGFSGISPFILTSNINNYNTINTSDSVFSILAPNGNYQILTIKDATHCTNQVNYPITVALDTIKFNLVSEGYLCDSNKVKFNLHLEGLPPFALSYNKNGTNYIETINDTTASLFLTNGTYNFFDLKDSTNCSITLSDQFTINETPVGYIFNGRKFNCSNAKTDLFLEFEGKSPWQLSYTKNGIADSIVFNNPADTLSLENGEYTLVNVKDSNHCVYTINEQYSINDSLPEFQIFSEGYVCDSNKVKFNLHLSGHMPFTIFYSKNGTNYTETVNDTVASLFLGNGTYSFNELKDSNECVLTLSDQFTINEAPVGYTFNGRKFNCSNSKTDLFLEFEGKSPWQLNYTKNGIADSIVFNNPADTLSLENGEYTLVNVKDSNNCVYTINEQHSIHDSLPEFQLTSEGYVCDSNKVKYQLHLTGRPPFTIYYNKSGTNYTETINDTAGSMFLSNGTYNFYALKDSNECFVSLTDQFTINEFPVAYFFNGRKFNCNTTKTDFFLQFEGKAPWQLNYTKDGVADSAIFNNATDTLSLENGEYVFIDVKDSNNCTDAINQPHSIHDSLPGFQLLGNGYLCLLAQTQVNYSVSGKAPWTLSYLAGNTPVNVTTSNANNSLYLPNNEYTFLTVTDSNGCIHTINQTIVIDENLPELISSQTQFDCSKDSFLFKINLIGKSPYTLYYNKNGGPADSFIFTGTTDSTYIARGTYYWDKVVDSNNCSYVIDQTITLTDSLPELSILDSGYVCTKDSSYFVLRFAGTPPWQLYYEVDNVAGVFTTSNETDTLWLGNGVLQFEQLKDVNSCIFQLSNSFTLSNYQPQANILYTGYDCNSQRGYTVIHSKGNMPMQMSFSFNQGAAQVRQLGNQAVAHEALDTLWLENGMYDFSLVTDHNGCVYNIDTTLSIDYHPLEFNHELEEYNCANDLGVITFNILSGNPPYAITVNNNGSIDSINFSSSSITYQFNPGTLHVMQVRDNNCTQYPDLIIELNNDSLRDPYSIFLDGLQVKTKNEGIQYTWYYNNKPFDTTEVPITQFIGNGTYFIAIENENGCIYYTYPIMLSKGRFVAFPNPVKDEVNLLITLPADTSIAVNFYDANGRIVKTATITNGINNIPVSDLGDGLYIIKVDYKGIGYSFDNLKIIKNKR